MQTSTLPDFDIAHYKTNIEEAPTEQNGWKLEYEGHVEKEFKDSTMKVYRKKETSATAYTIRIDAVLKGVKPENIVTMTRDMSYREKEERPPKHYKIVENTSESSDISYIEINLPFPMTNRDFLQKRLFLHSKKDQELVKRLGLFNWDHTFHVIMMQSVQRADYPVKSKPIRAETRMNYMLFEEDPKDSSVLKVRWVLSQDLRGDLPKFVINAMGEKVPRKMIADLMSNHAKWLGKA